MESFKIKYALLLLSLKKREMDIETSEMPVDVHSKVQFHKLTLFAISLVSLVRYDITIVSVSSVVCIFLYWLRKEVYNINK